MFEVSHAIGHLSSSGGLSAREMIFFGGLLIGVPLVDACADLMIYRLQYSIQETLQPHALRYDLEHHQSDFSEQTRSWVGQEGVSLQFYILQQRLSGLVCFVVLAQWNVILALLLALTTWYSGHKTFVFAQQQHKQLENTADEHALRSQFFWRTLTSPEFAEESRLYGVGQLLAQRYHKHMKQRLGGIRQDLLGGFSRSLCAHTPFIIALGLYFAWVLTQNDIDYPAFLSSVIIALPGLAGLGNQGVIQLRAHHFDDMVRKSTELRKTKTGAPISTDCDLSKTVIELRDVNFRYSDELIFNGLSLSIRSGEKVAVVGPNGAGKSTLIKLITGHSEPTSGIVCVGGVSPTLQFAGKGVGYVAQDFMLFPGSADDGMRLGRPVLHKEFPRIVQQLGISELLLDDKGKRSFSRGQWQKLAIARALVSPPGPWGRIIVLDEPTASLDIRAEQALYDSVIQNTQDDDIVVVVTHRLHSVVNVDRIIVIDDGKIIQQGTHVELLAEASGLYARMFNAQQDLYLRSQPAETDMEGIINSVGEGDTDVSAL
ncbi:ATP-binding cassette domain-containing protein [Corynebacterium poyangense]|nr:ABC transporter ATP-binding protein [Corynebacterium poyangense]